MKLIVNRHVDEFGPGAELTAGRYDEAMLGSLIDKGHVAIVEDAEPGTAANLTPEEAKAAAEKRRGAALKAFAAQPGKGQRAETAPLEALVIERIPEAESDTVTRVYRAGDEKGTAAPEPEKAGKAAKSDKDAKQAK